MPGPSKDSIETISVNDARMNWPQSVKALHMTGVSKRTLENMVRSGQVRYVYDPSGNRLFDPESLQEAAGIVNDSDIDADLSKVVIEQARRSIKDLTEANQKMMSLMITSQAKVTNVLRRENRALRGRCRELEKRELENIEAFEAALTASHERELARTQAEAREKRLDNALNKALEQVPAIIEQLSFKRAIVGFTDSLTAEQQGLLFEMLTPKQLETLGKIMSQKDSSNKARSPSGSQTDSNTKQTGEAPAQNKE